MDEQVWREGRRIVANLPAGTPLLAAVDAVCHRHGVTAGEVLLRGALRNVRLSVAPSSPAVSLDGDVQVVTAQGELAPDLGITGFNAVLSWMDHGIPRVAAGTIEDADCAGVRIVICAWDQPEEGRDAPVRSPARPTPEPRRAAQPPRPAAEAPRERASERPTVRQPAPPAERPHSPPPADPRPALDTPPAQGGWAAAVAASQAAPPAAGRSADTAVTKNGAGPLDEDPEAKAGDILIHTQFGRCKVVGQGDGDRVKIRMSTGRFVDLHLSYIRLVRQADEGGVRVFRVEPTRR